MPVSAPTRRVRLALVGNPNVGKSSVFNHLTGLAQRVSNFAGVTVESTCGHTRHCDFDVFVIDLPGTYSLVSASADEEVVMQVLSGACGEPLDAVVAVLDATNLRRSLFLLSEVLDCGLPVVVAINMVDEARQAGIAFDTEAIARDTGCPCIETIARTGHGIPELLAAAVHEAERGRAPLRRWRLDEEEEARHAGAIDAHPDRSRALAELRGRVNQFRRREIEARYRWVFTLVDASATDCAKARRRSDRIDAVVLHPLVGPTLFVLIMGLMFQSIFALGTPLMEQIDLATGWLQGLVRGPGIASQLLADGVIAGAGAVLIFLPQILILFLLLGLLEDSGYMTRAAFIVDRPLKVFGLSGRSFIPLLSAFACAVPGILAARTIPSRRERLLTIFIAPLMTCSARLPVYTLLIAAFLPDHHLFGVVNVRGLVLLALYLGGMAAAVVFALLLQRFRHGRRTLPAVLELPPYRLPSPKSVLLRLAQRAGAFVRRAGTVIVFASVVLWALAFFPRYEPPEGMPPQQAASEQLARSCAGRIGHVIEPALKPIGLDWKVGIGLVSSFAARELFVSSMAVVYAVGEQEDAQSTALHEALRRHRHEDTGEPVFTVPGTLSLLVFYVFSLQCVATIAVVYRETGSWRFPLVQILCLTGFAWVAAFLTYHGARALGL